MLYDELVTYTKKTSREPILCAASVYPPEIMTYERQYVSLLSTNSFVKQYWLLLREREREGERERETETQTDRQTDRDRERERDRERQRDRNRVRHTETERVNLALS